MTMDGGIVRGQPGDGRRYPRRSHALCVLHRTLRNLVFEDNTALGENSYGGALSFYGSDSRDIQRLEIAC